MKIAIIYAYNGAKFQGSQTQPNGKAVEDALNLALRKIGVFSQVNSSSRTDTGVHALMQLSSVDV
ncbi:MAG: tRNA pseudouridine(38-40) synthase TruA, partial [Campylobacter lanienae]|nr:tRNA pseudouridine(38-40) synthase TruA [Campylobacteraceae bacterium]MDY2818442.1 tRNA pseudouridine(38-40) synthase TruA [Campylobacter lanienae]